MSGQLTCLKKLVHPACKAPGLDSKSPKLLLADQTWEAASQIRFCIQVHWNYVDCVRWMGDIIVSKSVDNKVMLWQETEDPDSQKSRSKLTKTGVHLLQVAHLLQSCSPFLKHSFWLDFQAQLCQKLLGSSL